MSVTYAECIYAECHYAECRYAECHGAENLTNFPELESSNPAYVDTSEMT
jgi:hypothetical protein